MLLVDASSVKRPSEEKRFLEAMTHLRQSNIVEDLKAAVSKLKPIESLTGFRLPETPPLSEDWDRHRIHCKQCRSFGKRFHRPHAPALHRQLDSYAHAIEHWGQLADQLTRRPRGRPPEHDRNSLIHTLGSLNKEFTGQYRYALMANILSALQINTDPREITRILNKSARPRKR
jgi:hypothetical protein